LAKAYRCCGIILFSITLTHASDAVTQIQKQYDQLGKPKNAIVVFDIDDTLLSNQWFIEADGAYILKRIIGFQRLAQLPLIDKQKAIYDWCIAHDVGVVMITFRCDTEYSTTVVNLKEQGIGRWQKLVLFPSPCDYATTTAQAYKEKVRQGLVKDGFYVLATVGDQYSDIEGKENGIPIKAKDPGYLTK
jgi:predicted secreted acid phosphatase